MSLSSLPDNQAMGPRSELTYVEPHAGRSHGAHERQTDAVVPLPKRTRLATQPTGPLGKDEPNRKRTRWRRAREWTVLPQHSHPSDQMRVPGAYDECAGNDKVRCQREDRLAEERSRPCRAGLRPPDPSPLRRRYAAGPTSGLRPESLERGTIRKRLVRTRGSGVCDQERGEGPHRSTKSQRGTTA